MKLLITNARICDPQSPNQNKSCDVFIENGVITNIQISKPKGKTPSGYKRLDADGNLLLPGLVDMRADFCDPGQEYSETLKSGAAVALAGGFTDVALLPNTSPTRDTKVGIEYVINQSKQLPIHLYAYGALSRHRDGKEMAELFDMHQVGALGFTDGNRPITNSGLLLRTLLYSSIFNGLLLVFPDDPNLSNVGRMHEGKTSTLLGLKGIPNLAEELVVHRDIELLRYAEGRLHFSAITSKGSVELIRKAKKQGLQVTADVPFANLVFTDEDLAGFDANYKVYPPLRSASDQKALWEGIRDGTIDAIVSNHQPQSKEFKVVEFEYARPGMITLQYLFSKLFSDRPKNVEVDQLIAALSSGPRSILGLSQVSVSKGSPASLVLFDPKQTWTYTNNLSLSENTPLLGQKMKGKVLAVFCKDQLHTF